MKHLIRTAATCLVLLGLCFASLHVSGVAAASSVQLSIDPVTHQAAAPASFTAGEQVMVWYNLPDGGATLLTRTDALTDGSLNWTIGQDEWSAIPANATSLVAHGDDSDVAAIYTFSHAAQAATGALNIDAATLQATAADFMPGEQVAVWYNLPDGSAAYVTRTNALTDGTLNWTIDADEWSSIPANATTLVAHGDVSGVAAIYTFAR